MDVRATLPTFYSEAQKFKENIPTGWNLVNTLVGVN
jgi:hypothetical protein